ncbi:MAG: Hsp20/alpha crystallin family protein [Methanobrevibacter sp.]
MDLLEDEENYYIKADIPGASKDSVNVTIEEQNVIITCEFQSFEDELREIAAEVAEEENKKEEDEEKELKYLIQGRITGKAKRIIPLSKKIKTKESKAKYKKGTVTLTIPKVKPKAYNVTVE